MAGLFLAVSCSSSSEEKKPVKNGVDAEIHNLQDSTLLFYSQISPIDQIKGKSSAFTKEIKVDSNGIFVEPLDLDEGYYFLEYDHNKSLYFIQKGKRLSLDFDAERPTDKPDYSGKLKYESRYLFDKQMAHANFIANESKYYTYNETEFLNAVNLLRGKMDTMLVMYIANHPTGSKHFMQQEALTNLYFMASYIESYPIQRAYFEDQEPVSIQFLQSTESLNLNDTNAINNPQFYNFISNYVRNRTGRIKTKEDVNRHILFVDSLFTVDAYKDYLRFHEAKTIAQDSTILDKYWMLDTLQNLISDSEIKQFLIKNIQNDTSRPHFNHVILEDQ
jgi:hypothetical protein